MRKEKQIFEEIKREVKTALARPCGKAKCSTCEFRNEENCDPSIIAEYLCNADYRKRSEVIDDFVKRLLDAFPEPHRGGNICPAIYYYDYREIIEEIGAKMKGGEEQ